MSVPNDPPANEPTLPEPKPVIPVEAKIEEVIVVEAKPVDDGNSKIQIAVVPETQPADKFEDIQKSGSVYTKGLIVCGNCGTELLGETCYRCGQPTKGLVRQFSSIMGDFLDTVLNIDTRVFRTLGPLIVKPGFLTQEYFSGRRIRFVSPVRLFFFLAVLTFLLAQFSLPDMSPGGKNDAVQVNNAGSKKITKAKTIEEVEKLRSATLAELAEAKRETGAIPMVGAALESAKTKVNDDADKRIAELKKQKPAARPDNKALENRPIEAAPIAKPEVGSTDPNIDEEGNFSFNGELWDAEKNPIKLGWAPAAVNAWFNSLAQRAQDNGKHINKDPKVIIEALLSSLPMTLFIMLPIFALLLKIMFIFKRRLYMEHLIVALHSHAFLMVAMFLLILFNDISTWLNAYSWVTVPLAILTTVLWIWIPIYLFLMQKRVYQQGWILTFVKYNIIGFLHFILLTVAITCTLAIKMIWL